MEIPAGVHWVAMLTLLSIFPLGMLFLLTLRFSADYLPLLFGLFALISSILLFTGVRSRFLWGSFIAYWVVLFVYFVPLTVGIWSATWEYTGFRYLATYQIESLIVVIFPHIYAAGCSVYFLFSKRALRYFGLIKVNLASK